MPDTVVALGEQALLEGFRLAGASVQAAETDDEVRRAWTALPPAAAVVVILTPRAADALGTVLADPRSPMTVVLPR
jgi:vacuolar-type H+-ATPase subunit F/Vma7